MALCVTVKLLTPDYDIFTEAINWSLTYDLPESVQDYDKNLYGYSPPVLIRRKRANFYKKLEILVDKWVHFSSIFFQLLICDWPF